MNSLVFCVCTKPFLWVRNRTVNASAFIHIKVETSDVCPCLISGLDNCIKRDLIENDVI